MYKNHWLKRKEVRDDAMIVYNLNNKVPVWDFQTALGDTIRDKYESLYVKIIEVNGIPYDDFIKGKQ